MVMSVNTNISSLNAQKNLATSQSKLATAIERLSSGMRINSAKDDAAGLAISTRFTTQINGLNQAVSNANDGISLAQTTESALNEVTNNMQRIRTLAVQSANATNSDSDRAALDAEVQQRLAEITRISQQTTFNGRHVLDGTFGSAAFQIGANVGETISVNMTQGAGASQIGQIATSKTGDISAAFSSGAAGLNLAAGDLTIDMGAGAGAVDVAAGNYTDAASLVAAINTAAGSTVAAVSGNEIAFTNSTGNAITFGGAANPLGVTSVAAQTTGAPVVTNGTADSTGLAAKLTTGFTLDGTTNSLTIDAGGGGTVVAPATYNDAQDFADAINAAYNTDAGTTGKVFATVVGGELHFENDDTGNAVSMTGAGTSAGLVPTTVAAASSAPGGTVDGTATSTGVNAAVTAASSAVPLTLANGDLTINGTDMEGTYKDAQSLVDAINSKGISGVSAYYDADSKSVHLNSQQALTVAGTRAGATGPNPGDPVGLNFAGAGAEIATASNLAASDVKTVAGANDTISRIDAALGTISSMRSDLGAVQNRFTSTIANLQTISQNLSASRSQIQDADFAAETANMSSANILQQAGVSVLAQANATTQSVLKLLQ
jgi:flagellin